jgi:hypothetical protein
VGHELHLPIVPQTDHAPLIQRLLKLDQELLDLAAFRLIFLCLRQVGTQKVQHTAIALCKMRAIADRQNSLLWLHKCLCNSKITKPTAGTIINIDFVRHVIRYFQLIDLVSNDARKLRRLWIAEWL